MNDLITYPVRLPADADLTPELTSSGQDLADALDTWLADDFLHEDWLHVHSWNDDEEIAR
jgi:hypothetical protein